MAIKGQGGLAGVPTHRDDDHQLVSRDGHVYVLEVVLSHAFDDDILKGHGRGGSW